MTMTITSVQVRQHEALASRQAQNNDYFSILQNLGSILLRNQHEYQNDDLSQALFKEGGELFAYIINPEAPPCLEVIKEHFNKLKTLLQNPNGNTMFEEPVLIGDLVWEKDFLEYYTNCWSVAFPAMAIPFQVRPHVFAMDMIQWIKELESFASFAKMRVTAVASHVNEISVRAIAVTPMQRIGHLFPKSAEGAKRELNLFYVLQESRMREKTALQIGNVLERKNQLLQSILMQMHEERSQAIVRLQEECLQRTREVQGKLEDVKNNYQVSLQERERFEVELKGQIKELQVDLKQKIEEITSQRATIGHLIYQNQCLSAHVQQLACQVNNSNDDCNIL